MFEKEKTSWEFNIFLLYRSWMKLASGFRCYWEGKLDRHKYRKNLFPL